MLDERKSLNETTWLIHSSRAWEVCSIRQSCFRAHVEDKINVKTSGLKSTKNKDTSPKRLRQAIPAVTECNGGKANVIADRLRKHLAAPGGIGAKGSSRAAMGTWWSERGLGSGIQRH